MVPTRVLLTVSLGLLSTSSWAGPCAGQSGRQLDACVDTYLELLADEVNALKLERADLQAQVDEATAKRDELELELSDALFELTTLTSGGLATEAWVTSQGYLTTESDPTFTASAAAGLSAGDVSGWSDTEAFVSDLRSYVAVDTGAVTVSGANLYVQSGSGSTSGTVNGLGNLIVGYDGGSQTKTGSHNLIIGHGHTYTSYAGLIAGYQNSVTAPYGSVAGGRQNTTSGEYASMLGGRNGTVSGTDASITGGYGNIATGQYSVAVGGYENEVNDSDSVVVGGTYNTILNGATGYSNTLVGGFRATMEGDLFYSVMSYGFTTSQTTGGYFNE